MKLGAILILVNSLTAFKYVIDLSITSTYLNLDPF